MVVCQQQQYAVSSVDVSPGRYQNMKTNKIVKMAVENIIVFFVYIQSTLGIFNPQLLYYNPTYSSPRSQFQVGSKFIIHLKCLSLLFSSSFCKIFCKISNFKLSLVLESVCRCVWVCGYVIWANVCRSIWMCGWVRCTSINMIKKFAPICIIALDNAKQWPLQIWPIFIFQKNHY